MVDTYFGNRRIIGSLKIYRRSASFPCQKKFTASNRLADHQTIWYSTATGKTPQSSKTTISLNVDTWRHQNMNCKKIVIVKKRRLKKRIRLTQYINKSSNSFFAKWCVTNTWTCIRRPFYYGFQRLGEKIRMNVHHVTHTKVQLQLTKFF